MITMTVSVNGEASVVAVDPHTTLLTVLRDTLQLTGAKCGCNQGVCGACTVLADGRPARACLMLAADCDGREIETVEGLSENGLAPVQQALIDTGAVQCGYCTPGVVMAATALLRGNPAPDADAVREGLSGNLCRCSGYAKIVEAVTAAGDG